MCALVRALIIVFFYCFEFDIRPLFLSCVIVIGHMHESSENFCNSFAVSRD